jgi:hypothetical protein
MKYLKMELIEGSETSANHNRTPGKCPEEYIQDSKHGESLKSRMCGLWGGSRLVHLCDAIWCLMSEDGFRNDHLVRASKTGSWTVLETKHPRRKITNTLLNEVYHHVIRKKNVGSRLTCYSNVYWTVHHCNSWRMKDQLDVTCYFISLIMRWTCFEH